MLAILPFAVLYFHDLHGLRRVTDLSGGVCYIHHRGYVCIDLQQTNMAMEKKTPFLIGDDASSNGCFSIVMVVFGGVVSIYFLKGT